MNEDPEIRRSAALAANEACRFAEAYQLWLPLADAGDPEAQGSVGSMLYCGCHRYESVEQLNSGVQPDVDESTTRAERDEGARLMEIASAAGFGPASFNLAGMYVSGYGGGSWAERKERAAKLFALAHAQEFAPFGWLMHSEGPGQPYLDIMENHAITEGVALPGEQKPS